MDRMKQNGFTLIELIITVTVLGILLALAGPSMFEILERRKIVGAADLLLADLRFAKVESIKRNQPVRVTFKYKGTTNWCYGLRVNADCDCKTANSCNIDGVEKVVDSDDFSNSLSATWDYASDKIEFDSIRGFVAPATTSDYVATFAKSGASATVETTPVGKLKICSDTGVGGYPSC